MKRQLDGSLSQCRLRLLVPRTFDCRRIVVKAADEDARITVQQRTANRPARDVATSGTAQVGNP
jgi:hypothetical protein